MALLISLNLMNKVILIRRHRRFRYALHHTTSTTRFN